MHVLSYLYLLVLACFCHKVLSDSSEENSNNNPDKTIETTNNCSCVVYYLCDENNFIITDGRNILDERFGKGKEKNGSRVVKIPCSVDGYVCCKLKPSTTPDKPVVTSEQPEITTQPDFVSERAVAADKNKTRPGCGQQKTVLSVRVSVPAGDVSTTLPGEFPWMVAIFQKKSSPPNKYKFKCAGSLIHPKAVLTGTHCVVGTREGALKVIVNGESGFQDVDDNSKNVRAVSKTIKHPEYYSGGLYNDIALLVLEEPFNFAEGPINSVCIPKSDQIFDGKQCTATGWGANSQQADVPLKKVDLPIVDFDRCENLLRKTRLGNHFTLHPSFLCAGGEAGKDTCNGDGGGPLVCKNENNVYFQAGIVSWGINCAQKDIAGVYTDVAKFRKWIDEELKKYSIEIV